MATFTLKRSGTAALKFSGDLIAEASSKQRQGPGQNRWFELAAYGLEAGGYIAALGYRTCWQGEQDVDYAERLADAAGVRQHFANFDPCDPALWRGIPENVHDAGRRNSYYRDAIAAAYREAVSELLAGDEFAEEI